MLPYILQTTLCWTAFYLVYILLLRKETFFHINRWYLLATLVLGLLIPFIEWQPSPVIEHHPTYSFAVEPIQYNFQQLQYTMQEVAHQPNWNWTDFLMLLYWIGIAFFGTRLAIGLGKIWKLYRQSEVVQQGKIKVVYTQKQHLPFSFFHFLFWSKTFEAEHQEQAQILRHEEAHIHQWHTLDVLFMELLSILFWCSPILYFYRKSLRTTHEYLADALVLQNTNRKEYGHLLLKQSLSGLQIALANHFIHSQLKNRILMMTRNKSKKKAMWKYLPLLPVLLLAVLVFSKKEGRAQLENSVSNLLVEKEIEKSNSIIAVEKEIYEKSNYSDFIHPVQNPNKVTRTTGYGKRMNPIKKQRDFHHGIDYVIPENTKIVVTADGTVESIRNWKEGYGKHIIINHEDGYQTLYAHLNDVTVKEGQQVKQGTIIALSGNSGLSTGPHLHYEIRKNGESIDPQQFAIVDAQSEIFQVVEEMPRFPSDECEAITDVEERQDCANNSLIQYLSKYLKYPKAAKEAGVEGMNVVQFVVEKDGRLSEIQLKQDIGGGTGAETMRVLKKMEEDSIRWIPGMQDGRKVRVKFTLPVKFKLSSDEKEHSATSSFKPSPLEPEQILSLESVNISPNPNSGDIHLQFRSENAPLIIKVYNAAGTIVYQEKLQQFDGKYDQRFKLKTIASGIHFLTIEQNGKVFSEQLMIEK